MRPIEITPERYRYAVGRLTIEIELHERRRWRWRLVGGEHRCGFAWTLRAARDAARAAMDELNQHERRTG